jgi:putative serine protease PepD
MFNRYNRFVWLIIIILFIVIWYNRDNFIKYFNKNPSADSLDFNNPNINNENITIIESKDEKINIDVFEKVHPAVVNIAATTLSVNFWMQVIPREGQGSGFIIDKNGYILTNNHVVAKAQRITVTLSNGKKIAASLIGRDPSSDLAVIKIPASETNSIAILGDSDRVRVGQKAIAIGNPFGLSHTLTTGIVSALNREIQTGDGIQMYDLLQTDAAINPGNSGGPLLDSNGEVMGINTAIFSSTGGNLGIGFAIPINRAKEVATHLITTGRVARPWLGITGITIDGDIAKELGLDIPKGILIIEALPGSPASQAGLRGGSQPAIIGSVRLLLGGDIITALEGEAVSDMKSFAREISEFKVGQEISLEIIRNQTRQNIKVLLSERP